MSKITKLYSYQSKMIFLIILFSIIPQSSSVLSFTYPQSTTLSNKKILVVEENGIYICDSGFTVKETTLHTFSEDDKINSPTKLSKTIIKKSNFVILVFTSYKLYIIKTQAGALLYHNDDKLITDEDPEHITIGYSYKSSTSEFNFIIGYIDSNGSFKAKYYKFVSSTNSVTYCNSCSLNSITLTSDGNNYLFNIQNQGISCNTLRNNNNAMDAYMACYIIGKNGGNNYLLPIIFPKDNNALTCSYNTWTMDYYNVNANVRQIRSITDVNMAIMYVCYVDEVNLGNCIQMTINKNNNRKALFDTSSKVQFSKQCRSDIYGMKVEFLFEKGISYFTCSDSDGSLQVYFFDSKKKYLKYENCTSIYGYSLIYYDDYYITSDVICPEGKIPYNILIDSDNYNPEVIIIEKTDKPSTIVTTEISKISTIIPTTEIIETTAIIPTTQITETTVIISTTQTTKTTSIITTDNISKSSTIINSESYSENNLLTTNQINEQTTNNYNDKMSSIIKEQNNNNEITTNNIYYNTETIEERGIKTNIINNNNNDITEKTEGVNNCPEKCSECDSQKKCTKCNKSKNYYPIELTTEANDQQTIECMTQSQQQKEKKSFYFDSESESFKPCFENCETCYGHGVGNNNNCKTCSAGFILHPDYEDSKNCVPKPNPLYYINYGQYTVIESDQCPSNFNFLIEEKGKCIEDCKKDNKYQYTYDGLCYKAPPENTNDNDGDFICKDNLNICISTTKKLYTSNYIITEEEIEILTYKYAKEYNYTNYHISIYENDIYIIIIYKRGECISELGISSQTVDFGDCYNEIRTKNNLQEDNNLIVVQIKTKPGKENYKKSPSYALYNPITGVSFNVQEECKDQKISIQNNLEEELINAKVDIDDIKKMADYDINVFDPKEPFYSDLCTHYPDVLNKDVPLKKRILVFYPNINLCEDNCELIYVFLNNITAQCECPITEKEEENKKDKIKDNALYQNEFGQFEEFIYSTNINVIKCYKDIFKYEYFIKCYGGFILLGLIVIQILCALAYCCKSRYHLKKYFFIITNKYLNHLEKQKTIKEKIFEKNNEPPRKGSKTKTSKALKRKTNANIIDKKNMNFHGSKNISIYPNNSKDKINMSKATELKRANYKAKTYKKENFGINHKLSFANKTSDNLLVSIKDDYDLNIEEFLNTDPEDMDYDDALRRDNRTFCRFYCDKILSEQIILNTFFNKEYLKPMPIKIMLLVLQINLYLFINGLFYNEEYVTKIFELKKDSFSQKIWRFFDNLFYAFLVGVIINYIIEFFFIREKKLRTTLKREKNNALILKYEMIQIIKELQNKYISFIIVSFVISIFIWYHISCFNNIYSHMKKEWLIFSILIIICIQAISLLTSFLEAILRFMSFRCKSEKLFKLSLLFS